MHRTVHCDDHFVNVFLPNHADREQYNRVKRQTKRALDLALDAFESVAKEKLPPGVVIELDNDRPQLFRRISKGANR